MDLLFRISEGTEHARRVHIVSIFFFGAYEGFQDSSSRKINSKSVESRVLVPNQQTSVLFVVESAFCFLVYLQHPVLVVAMVLVIRPTGVDFSSESEFSVSKMTSAVMRCLL